jgi:protoporphyrinogen IX oxidase
MYLYLKALHIIFIVTWFAGMFYIVRLFIYNTEANEKGEPEKSILQEQFRIMIKRLWLGITWPSAVLTLIFGPSLWFMLDSLPQWLMVKLTFVIFLYVYHFTLHAIYKQQIYHFTLHAIYKQQMKGVFRFSSQQLRVWNEVATIFLVAIVMLAAVKQSLSFVWGLIGLIGFVIVLMSAIKIYKAVRKG